MRVAVKPPDHLDPRPDFPQGAFCGWLRCTCLVTLACASCASQKRTRYECGEATHSFSPLPFMRNPLDGTDVRIWLALLLCVVTSACASSPKSGAVERTAPAAPAEDAAGPFGTPEEAALAVARQVHPNTSGLEAELLVLLAGGTHSRVEVRGADGFCVVYSPVKQQIASSEGWYLAGTGTSCDALKQPEGP